GPGPALTRRCDRARAVGPGAARIGGRLGYPQERAVPRLPPGRLPRPGLPDRRRLRALSRAHGGDARVGAHRRAVPRSPRAHGGRAVDRGRPQGRPAAAGRAAHLDGVADPPLQDRDRGLPRAGGRGLLHDRVAPRRARLLHLLRRRAEAVAREVPRAVLRRPRGDGNVHARRADRRHDRDRRLARHRHGRGRPVTALYDELQEIRARYPEDSQSAVLPALRRAQEEYGWLSADALREVADALETTPAICKAVASFYDQLHLAPIGEHLVEVCTNVSCAVVGAQQVVEAFEGELGCRAGETTGDGKVTLRTVECLGGCGWATIVAVDHHYRTYVKADDVPAIVEELTGGD